VETARGRGILGSLRRLLAPRRRDGEQNQSRNQADTDVFTESSGRDPGSELRHAAQQLITGEVEQEVGGRLPPHGREIDLQASAVALALDRDDYDGTTT